MIQKCPKNGKIIKFEQRIKNDYHLMSHVLTRRTSAVMHTNYFIWKQELDGSIA